MQKKLLAEATGLKKYTKEDFDLKMLELWQCNGTEEGYRRKGDLPVGNPTMLYVLVNRHGSGKVVEDDDPRSHELFKLEEVPKSTFDNLVHTLFKVRLDIAQLNGVECRGLALYVLLLRLSVTPRQQGCFNSHAQQYALSTRCYMCNINGSVYDA